MRFVKYSGFLAIVWTVLFLILYSLRKVFYKSIIHLKNILVLNLINRLRNYYYTVPTYYKMRLVDGL